MSTSVKNQIRQGVLDYVGQHTPARISDIAEELRKRGGLGGIPDSDVRDVVQPMIVTGKLSYAQGLKIALGKPVR